MLQYLTVLLRANRLRVHPLPKPVLDKDAVYRLLHNLWVLDKTVYSDERQRVQMHGAILMSTFFGCRLASIFDTRVKLEAWNPNIDPDPASKTDSNSAKKEDDTMIEDSDKDEAPDGFDEDDIFDDLLLEEDIVDDDCLAGEDKTRTFLHRHIALYIVPGVHPLPNTVFMKITQPNTKGQDNNPRV